jgi:diguanylate cyclase (GGDEF)-like protein/PAS domain S-box-containing protein
MALAPPAVPVVEPLGEQVADEPVAGGTLLRSVVEGMTNAILVKDRDGRYLLVNAAAARLFGKDAEDFVGKRDADLFPPEVAPIFSAYEAQVIRAGQSHTYEIGGPAIASLADDGEDGDTDGEVPQRALRCVKYPFHDQGEGDEDAIQGVVVVLQDITESKRSEHEARRLFDELQASVARFRAVVEGLNEGIILTDLDDRILFVNPRMMEMTGYAREEMVGRCAYELLLPPTAWDEHRGRTEQRLAGESESSEIRLLKKAGEEFWTLINAGPYRDANGHIVGTLGAVTDISERKRSEDQVQWQASHDALTQLPNRSFFLERLDQVLTIARRRSEQAAVLFLDLDRFKNINDTLGHDVGDRLLRTVASRLEDCLGKGVTVARMGGDEFTILLPFIRNTSEATTVAQRLLETLKPPVLIAGRELYVSGSVGISLFPNDGSDARSLLKHADIAMYRAKEQGNGAYQFFSAVMNAGPSENLTMEQSLRKSIEREQFVLLYQPLVEAADNRLVGFEVLLRWLHPRLGLLAPDRFISLAEKTGLIVPLGDWVLRTACLQAAQWREEGWLNVPISVNLSARQFQNRDLTVSVTEVLRQSRLQSDLLTLELTETALMEHGVATVDTLQALKNLGVRLSLDDFGTGYSALAYLRQFPLDILKIDRTFVKGLGTENTDRTIVKVLIELAHALNLRVVAEGVETAAQREHLRKLNCDTVQGFLISRPMPASNVAEFVRTFADRPIQTPRRRRKTE